MTLSLSIPLWILCLFLHHRQIHQLICLWDVCNPCLCVLLLSCSTSRQAHPRLSPEPCLPCQVRSPHSVKHYRLAAVTLQNGGWNMSMPWSKTSWPFPRIKCQVLPVLSRAGQFLLLLFTVLTVLCPQGLACLVWACQLIWTHVAFASAVSFAWNIPSQVLQMAGFFTISRSFWMSFHWEAFPNHPLWTVPSV